MFLACNQAARTTFAVRQHVAIPVKKGQKAFDGEFTIQV